MVILWSTIGLSLVMSIVWTVYRLHDAGLPGSWIWLLVIPIVGNIGLILLLCIPSGTFDFFTPTYTVYYKRSQSLSN